jgi:hypothetical protein
MEGFPLLASIGGKFHVVSNNALTSIKGFQSLTTVGSYFYLYDNAKLTSVDPFHNLTTVKGEFYVSFSGASAQHFPKLECVGSYSSCTGCLKNIEEVQVGDC